MSAGDRLRAWTRDRGVRAGLALSATIAGVIGVALAASSEDALGERSIDARFVAVTMGAAIPLVALRLTRPGSTRLTKGIYAALVLPMPIALFAPRSALAVSWLAGGALFLAFEACVHAARAALRLGRSRATRAMLAALAALITLYYASAAFVVLFNTQLIVAPARLAHRHPIEHAGERTLTIETEDGLGLGATYTPGRAHAPAVLLVHGVADGRSRLAPWAAKLHALGHHVLRIDQRAHGTSEGAVCSYGQRETLDVRAALDRLRAMPEVDRDRIVVVGASMGGGTVLASAPWLPSRGVRGLVLLAPASRYGPLVMRRVDWLGPFAQPVLNAGARLARTTGMAPMVEWSPAAHVPADTPLSALVFHGAMDDTIPLALSRELVRAQPSFRLRVLPGVGHVAIVSAVLEDRGAWSEVERFLARVLHAGSTQSR